MVLSLDACSCFPLRFVDAILSNSCSSMDSYMDFEAPFSSLFFVSPRLADSAAPAAFCCALDFAGMVVSLHLAPKIARSTYAFVPGSFYDDAGQIGRASCRERVCQYE